ncbi:hypothetical protein C2E23DRAFT_843583 [Lenzites betulinus]|nr:hypothetical protein C2E23DRAFT_843583 [Lenzites betulinus]
MPRTRPHFGEDAVCGCDAVCGPSSWSIPGLAGRYLPHVPQTTRKHGAGRQTRARRDQAGSEGEWQCEGERREELWVGRACRRIPRWAVREAVCALNVHRSTDRLRVCARG